MTSKVKKKMNGILISTSYHNYIKQPFTCFLTFLKSFNILFSKYFFVVCQKMYTSFWCLVGQQSSNMLAQRLGQSVNISLKSLVDAHIMTRQQKCRSSSQLNWLHGTVVIIGSYKIEQVLCYCSLYIEVNLQRV